jgi:hypothetical protein
MKMNYAKKIEIIEAVAENTWSVYEHAKKNGSDELAGDMVKEYCALKDALYILTDTDYAKKAAEIYKIK